jgi:hypothetical protein
VSVRFLHVVRRQAVRLDGDVRVPIDELHVGADRHLSWDEATEREVRASVALGAGTVVVPIEIAAGEVTESLGAAGLVVRSWERIDATLTVETTPAGDAFRLSVAVGNTSDPRVTERDGAVRHTLASAHVVLRSDEGTFVSLLDPPPALADETARCRNEGLWPVLVGEDGSRDTMLAAPIILYDYPRVAPESPGDFFDGGEIDQLLVLNVLSLTDEERREMRDSDPRAREILERCNALSEEELMRLHGVVRAMRLCTPTQECPDA